MHVRSPLLLLLATLVVSGCAPDADPAATLELEREDFELELERRRATEHSLGIVVEVARELRDRGDGVTPPAAAELHAALRTRLAPTEPPSAAPNDAWGRPLQYDIVHERDGASLRNGFRVTSAGPNGRFELGGGDDLQRSAIVTETIRGN